MRRVPIAAASFLLAACLVVPPVRADEEVAPGEVTAESRAAAERGLEWLASRQDRQGCWGGNAYPVAVTSLACLAFMADGHLPGTGKGRYGEVVVKGIEYLLRCARSSKGGFITEPDAMQSRMHGHGFATLALAEAYGNVEIDGVDEALRKAVMVIERAQTRDGGWGYEPTPTADEASVTVACVQALRAARNAGVTVDRRVVERGLGYLRKCQAKDGSFRYSLSMRASNTSFALTAGAVSSLALLGETGGAEYEAGLAYMRKAGHSRAKAAHYSYENFYALLAMFYAGGEDWEGWYPVVRDDLIRRQGEGGCWAGEISPEYCTAFACLMLGVPHRHLSLLVR